MWVPCSARHACGSKLIPPPTLSSDGCFPLLSCVNLLVPPILRSEGVQGVSLSTVSVVFDCTPAILALCHLDSGQLLIICESWLVVAICRATPTSDHRRFVSRIEASCYLWIPDCLLTTAPTTALDDFDEDRLFSFHHTPYLLHIALFGSLAGHL